MRDRIIAAAVLFVAYLVNWAMGVERGETGDHRWTRRSFVVDVIFGGALAALVLS